MNVAMINECFGYCALWLAGCSLAVCAAIRVVRCVVDGLAHCRDCCKKYGWPFAAIMALFSVAATISGTPTRDDKEIYRQGQNQNDTGSRACASVFKGDGRVPCVQMSSVSDGLEVGLAMTDGATGNATALLLVPSVQSTDTIPSIRPCREEDYAAGIVLSEIGMGEIFDFAPPLNADICEDWRRFGASCDWFKMHFTNGWSFVFGTNTVDEMTVFSYGTACPKIKDTLTFVSPLEVALDIAPVSNWDVSPLNGTPSQFWQYLTPSNSCLMTWQNVVPLADPSGVMSFQIEYFSTGGILFRYDLSCVSEAALSNLVVGVRNGGRGRVFTRLARGTTSLHWARLDPNRAGETDPDGDGLSTDQELFEFRTDPYNPDSDGDGITDGEDANPMNPDADNDGIPDGMSRAEYFGSPLWADANAYGATTITLNQPVISPAFAVLTIDDLKILLTTNAQYRLNLEHGTEHIIRLKTNRIQPVDLSLGKEGE